jgi:hypothetical protein
MVSEGLRHFSQWILISCASGLKSGLPVRSSAFFSLASAAAKASRQAQLEAGLEVGGGVGHAVQELGPEVRAQFCQDFEADALLDFAELATTP